MAGEEETEIEHTTRAVELVTIFKRLANRANKPIEDAWANMLEVTKSSYEFYTSVGVVAKSLQDLQAEIAGSSLRPASKVEYVNAVKKLANYVQLDQLRTLHVDHLKQETDAFRLLTLLDDVLMPIANREVSAETLEEWTSILDELIAGAETAFEDEALRKFVLWQLSHLQWAIKNYDMLGIDGLSRAYGAVAAELARSQGMKGAQTSDARKWYHRAKKPLLSLGVAIAATSAVVEQADNLLTHGAHIYEVLTGDESDEPEEEAR